MESSHQFRCESEWVGGDSAFVTVEGELDAATSPGLKDVLRELDTGGIARHLVIDLSLCSFIDSTGLGLLVAAQRRADAPLDLVVTDAQDSRPAGDHSPGPSLPDPRRSYRGDRLAPNAGRRTLLLRG